MKTKGFTLIEMTVVLAVVAVLAAILIPTIINHITEANITRAVNEEQVITAAIMMLYKDTGKWPNTDTAGSGAPAGNTDRVLSGEVSDPVATGITATAQSGAVNWGTAADAQQLYNFLYINNPNCTGNPNGASDYPTTGEFSWRGPYLDKRTYLDPWGNQYVVSSRYFPPTPPSPLATIGSSSSPQAWIICGQPLSTTASTA